MIPKMSVSPEATRARIMPLTRPLMVWMRICSRGMPTRSDSQVLVDDGVVGAQVRRGCVVADHALLHDVDAVRGLEGERHVLLHEEDGHAVAVQDVDDLVDLRDHARHEPFRRLVEENDLGLEHHGPRDGQHLLLAADSVPPAWPRRSPSTGKAAYTLSSRS